MLVKKLFTKNRSDVHYFLTDFWSRSITFGEREPFKVHYSMIEVQYFYIGTEALLVKIVFTENRLFKDKFLEKVGGANAPPAPPAPPPML